MQPSEAIRCSVCLEDYSLEAERRPRILPQCLHTFCEGCLEKLVGFSGFRIVCPMCREANDVADAGGVQNLPISTRVSLPPQTSPHSQALSILRFVDPDAPACPACGSLTLYAPLGQDGTIIQCHTCCWLGTGAAETQSGTIRGHDRLSELHQDNTRPAVQRPSLIAGLCELLSRATWLSEATRSHMDVTRPAGLELCVASCLFLKVLHFSAPLLKAGPRVPWVPVLSRNGASSVLIEIKSVPLQASLTFYHHFYIALWNGSYLSGAMEYAKHQMQNDTRFGRYRDSFVLLGLDTFVNLLDIKNDTLHQTMENIEQEVAETNKQDWLNPAPNTPPVADQEELLLKIQKSLEELIVNHRSMSSVLKLLHLLIKEAIKRLSHTDHVTVKLTANIVGIPGVSSMLNLLGFRFQSLAAHPSKIEDGTFQLASDLAAVGVVSNCSTLPISHAHPMAVIFPHWNPDRLLGVAQQAIAALIDLSACAQCVNALIWILPLTCDIMEQLISLLEKCQSSPTVCVRLTEKGVATLWNQPHLRDFLQVIGYERAGLCLIHNPRDLNKSLLLGSLSLFLALHPNRDVLSKLDPQQYSSASVRDDQTRQGPQETSAREDKQSREGPQEASTDTEREEQSRQDPQETSAAREEQSRQRPQETSTPREEQSRQDPQETSTPREEQSRQRPQETSTPREEQSRQDPQETSASTVEQIKQRPQEAAADTVRGKKTRQALQEITAARNKNRLGALKTSIARNKKTKEGALEASVASDKQCDRGSLKTAPDSKRTGYPSENSKVHLNTLKPLLVLRRQIMMQAPWLTVTPTSKEVRVKRNLAQRLNSLSSQQQAHIYCMEGWHKKALQELERKPEKRENKRQECSPKKVKVKGPATPSTTRILLDAPMPVSQDISLRATAQEIIKEQEECVRHRHRAAVKDLFLPFIDPLP